jgi:hypothetical protein
MPLSDEQLTDKFAVMAQNRLTARQINASVQEFIDALHTAIKN